MTLIVDVTHVASRKPTIAHDRLSRFWMTIVATHDVAPAHEHLTIFGDLHFDFAEGFADRSDAIIVRTIRANDAGFGHAIALENVYPRAEERIRKCRR